MRHPTDGVLRRLLDEPAGVGDADREHVVDCPQCLTQLTEMRSDAVLVDAALTSVDGAPTSVDHAWQRLSASAAVTPVRAAHQRSGRRTAMLRRPIVAVVVVVVVTVVRFFRFFAFRFVACIHTLNEIRPMATCGNRKCRHT